MQIDRQVVEQAWEALEGCYPSQADKFLAQVDAANALRTALKQPAPSEPESLEDWLANTPEAPAEAPDRHEWKPSPSVVPVIECCINCGSFMSDTELIDAKKENPKFISCCPDREFLKLYTASPDTTAQIAELMKLCAEWKAVSDKQSAQVTKLQAKLDVAREALEEIEYNGDPIAIKALAEIGAIK